jgi:hypothetical protein
VVAARLHSWDAMLGRTADALARAATTRSAA